MASDKVYISMSSTRQSACNYDVSATESNMLNSDGKIDTTTRNPLIKIVSSEIGEIQSDTDDLSIRQLQSGPQDNFCKRTRITEARTSNIQEKTPVVTIPRFFLDDRIVIIFSHACQGVLKAWGPYSNLQNLLKKYGIETHRFDQSELRTLKSIGAVDVQVKQCSFITEDDFLQLLLKYDENCNTDNAKYIEFSHPVDISRPTANVPHDQSGKIQVIPAGINSLSQSTISSSYKVCAISIRKQDFISLSETNSLLETHFERPELLTQVLLTLKVAVGKFTARELERIDVQVGVDDDLRRLYITRKDFERVMQYTSALLDKNLPNIAWVHLGELSASCTLKTPKEPQTVPAGSGSCSSTAAAVQISGNYLDNDTVSTSFSISQSTSIADDHSSESSNDSCKDVLVGSNPCHVSTAAPSISMSETPSESPLTQSEIASTSDPRYIIRTCLVNNEVCVCIPDLHKAVIDMYGQSVQVGNYMHRLSIPTHRFSSVLLKRLKAHNILSSKATLCTYITKTDAERLLKMYSICNHFDDGSDSLHRIEWGEPIILENAINKDTGDCLKQVKQSNQATLKIPLFVINDQIVVAMPDVHKAVQLLNRRCGQLHYNLETLGIVTHKYSYTEVNQMKVLSSLRRPSLCAYITKTDFDRLLQFYVTPENKGKLKLIEWQPPIPVERAVSGTAFDNISSPDVETVSIDNSDDNAADGEMSDDYTISDLYKVFVGDDLESIHSTKEDDEPPRTLPLMSPLSLPSSPSLGISQPVKHTTITHDSRDELDLSRGHLQPNSSTAMPASHLCSLMNHHTDCNLLNGAVNQAAADVNQKQVDACSGKTCPSNNTAVTSQTDLSSQMFGTIVATSNCSCCNINLSDFKKHARSAITTATGVHSTSSSAARARQIPSFGSTYFTSFGKLLVKINPIG